VCIAVTGTATGETVIDVWKDVKTPQAPEPKPMTLDSATTALLLLDFNKQVCNNERRPRCIASVPAVAKLAERARAGKVAVVYSLTAGSSIGDVAPALAARPGEPSVTSGPDKFLGTDLERILKERGITTVIVTGTAAHGAVLNTASGAAFRGLKVILPVDGLSAEDLYAEQYTVWHLLNAPRVSTQTTVTRTDMITFR
jgi:nicotinamidase-related amidase